MCLSTTPSSNILPVGELLQATINNHGIPRFPASLSSPTFSSDPTLAASEGSKSTDSDIVDTLSRLCESQLYPSQEEVLHSCTLNGQSPLRRSRTASDIYSGTLLGMAMSDIEARGRANVAPDNDASSQDSNVLSYLVGPRSSNSKNSSGINNKNDTTIETEGHAPSDTCDLSAVYQSLYSDVTNAATNTNTGNSGSRDAKDGDSNGVGQHDGRRYPRFRVKCYNNTTHCRIRAGPSLKCAQVGDMASGQKQKFLALLTVSSALRMVEDL